jgi:hypothetical protein
VATLYDKARPGRHKTNKGFLALDETRKSISNRSMSLKGEKCSMVVGVGRGVVLYHKKRLSIF